MSRLVDQPSSKPTPKIVAAGAGGAATLVVTWVAETVGVDVPERVASALVLLAALAAGYLKRERRPRGTTPGTNGRPDHAA